jgi:hypothetical protein
MKRELLEEVAGVDRRIINPAKEAKVGVCLQEDNWELIDVGCRTTLFL